MESYARPIRQFAERMRAFVSRPRARLFHVWVDGMLRDSVLEVIMGLEYHADNRSPFVRLDPSYRRDGGCWDQRLSALRAAHDARRTSMQTHGYALPQLPPAPSAGTPLARFAAGVAQVSAARCEPLNGLVIVLAPGMIEDAKAFEDDLSKLVLAPELSTVRWILVEHAACSIGPGFAASAAADYARVEVDEQEALRDFEAKIEACSSASPDAPGPAQTGAAWPSDAIPPGAAGSNQRNSAATASLAASLGLPAGLFGGALRDMRNHVLRGALALRRGDPAGAARQQSWAAQAALKAGLDREATLMEMVLANYLVHAEQRDLAEERYRACAERSKSKEWFDLAAQSYLAIGSLRLLERDRGGASVAYAAGGRVAEDGGEKSLAIEGYRMAGQCTAEDGNLDMAARLFQQAMAVADPMDDATAGQTSAPIAARQLAEHYQRVGLEGQAQSLLAQADRMDAAAQGEEETAA